jgi:hypothetical protein
MAIPETSMQIAQPVEAGGERPSPVEAGPSRVEREQRRELSPVRGAALPHQGVAILTMGILSLVLPCGIGLILGPIAWIMGNNDLRQIHAGQMDPDGEGLTQAGRICGIIGTCLNALCVCGGGASSLVWPRFRRLGPHF